MDRILFVLQTTILAIAGGIASSFTGVLAAAILSAVIFFGLLVHHSFGGDGVYLNSIMPVVFTAFGIFKWLAIVGAIVGFFVGVASIISERSRV